MKVAVAVVAAIALLMVSGRGSISQTAQPRDPVRTLAGNWALSGFVIGGGYFSFRNCFEVSIAASSDGAVGASASCGEVGDYVFRLKPGVDGKTYALTVKSKYGVSVEDFPVTYDGDAWKGSREQDVDGAKESITASVEPLKDDNRTGWKVEVRPTASLDVPLQQIRKPYFSALFSRAK